MVSDTIKDGVTTLTRKIRARGLKQLAVVAARQNPPVDKLYDAKEGYEGTYKLVKGKNPPLFKRLLSLGERADREETRRERRGPSSLPLDGVLERLSSLWSSSS